MDETPILEKGRRMQEATCLRIKRIQNALNTRKDLTKQ